METIVRSTNPAGATRRIPIVDILRGYALLGVIIINYTLFSNADAPNPGYADKGLHFFATYVFFHKSALLLSILFGYGFAVLISNQQSKGQHVVGFFLKRMCWLFVFAIVNSCFFSGDILKSYAILGVVLLLFRNASAKMVLVFAIILLALVPFSSAYTTHVMSMQALETNEKNYPLFLSHRFVDVLKYNLSGSFIFQATWPFYSIFVQHVMLCCFLWGMYLHKTGFMENIRARIKTIQRLCWGSFLAFFLFTFLSSAETGSPLLEKYYNFFIVPFLCGTVFFSSALIWLYIAGKFRRLFRAMEYFGKMTLTNYFVQNIISFFLFSGIGLSLGKSLSYWVYFVLAVTIYVLQLFTSRYWLRHYYYGPVEWLWRRLSAPQKLPFKK
jgi:uncharacterized protein